ncbi:PTS system 2-O-a-mannosyl-D-glycerate specific transporter subunit IIABC [Escherichia coli]|nr:PTS system 2-O-a-mannosyl-D-glycerate specific transporter subunit IIABC [Escherichia coli]SQL42187.1 PTS system 2-O-a-mannosyl-D-glycerate specific transporter subunit IIABC [Escherichia coli]SQL55877.1 PTS system 2-O-a-mannosyl-D-glycerate specific transporter subunit IIABC [Escherichia coli]
MNLTTLTHRDALCLNARFTSREEAIHALTQRLAALGKISSTEQFLEEVYRRESLGPTALGEGLAVPHGKTAAVKEAAFAVATLSEPLQWEGVDGPEAVDLVVLLAIPPNEAGTTHMQLLTALTTRLRMMRFGRVYSRRRRLMSCSRRWMTREARNLLPLFPTRQLSSA